MQALSVPIRLAPLITQLAGLALLAACAVPLQAGLSEAEVAARMGPPTGRYVMPSGTTRLEFARGPMGRTTWMVDLDAAGRTQQWAQVLDDAHFAQVVDGLPRDDLLRLLGRPAHRAREWQNRETWYWRYQTNDCLWFAVTLSAEGRVLDGGGHMPDPACDALSDKARP
jgi:hypothetical protein